MVGLGEPFFATRGALVLTTKNGNPTRPRSNHSTEKTGLASDGGAQAPRAKGSTRKGRNNKHICKMICRRLSRQEVTECV